MIHYAEFATRYGTVSVTYRKGDTHVSGSYKVRSPREIASAVSFIRCAAPAWASCRRRTAQSMRREWEAHNLLYRLHVARARTAAADFEPDTGRALAACYYVLSALYRAAWRVI